jgi:predicted nucleic acid-binding protein
MLAGARDQPQLAALQSMLAGFTHVAASSPHDHDVAAGLFRSARATGKTVRSLIDCLIAAMAVRLEVPVLAQDRDFEVLASVSALRLA